MAAEFERNRCPGWLQFDVDFAENGSIITAEEVQSQYWKINSFTLFVQVVSWLVSEAWVSRTSSLTCGMAVTVELEGASERGSIQPGKGSYWAEVVSMPVVDAIASDEALQVTRHFMPHPVDSDGTNSLCLTPLVGADVRGTAAWRI
eukprot:362004-Prymnesium_polylepis.1